MKFSPILCFHLFIAILQCSSIENAALKPIFSSQACFGMNNSVKTLETVVGVGFDNLKNIPTSLIFEQLFSECKTSSTGAFLYPANVLLISVNKIDLDHIATYFTRYEDYFKSTANSINVGFSKSDKFSISGSFGVQWQNAKRLIDLEENVVFRTDLKHHEYTATLQVGSPLHANFKKALLTVAHAETDSYARYLAEMIVRNFGTHVIVKDDIGAILEQEDFIELSSNSRNHTSLNEFKIAVSVEFAEKIFGQLGVGISPSFGRTSVEEAHKKLETSKRHSQMKAIGGPTINKLIEGMAVSMQLGNNKQISAKPISFLIEDRATLDQYGEPLYTVINPDHLPEINSSSFEKLRSYLEDAIIRYYENNRIEGCTDPSKANYDATANFDNGECEVPVHNYSFGGMFQTCEIFDEKKKEWQKSEMRCHYDFPEVPNKATGKYSCRDDFEEIKLYSYEYTRVDHLWRTEITLRRTTFWCRRKEKDNEAIPSESGFMFGGVFTKQLKNPYTQTFRCPENFQQLKLNLSTSINDWLVVCVGQDYQQDNQYQIPFGGFFSCQTPNKFAKCPDGYTQRPFIEIHYCDMFYCVHPNSKRNMPLPELRLPPFSKPSFEKNSTSREYTDQPYNDEQDKESDDVSTPENKSNATILNGILIIAIILALIVLIFLIVHLKYKNTTIRTREHRRYDIDTSVNKGTQAVPLKVF